MRILAAQLTDQMLETMITEYFWDFHREWKTKVHQISYQADHDTHGNGTAVISEWSVQYGTFKLCSFVIYCFCLFHSSCCCYVENIKITCSKHEPVYHICWATSFVFSWVALCKFRKLSIDWNLLWITIFLWFIAQ